VLKKKLLRFSLYFLLLVLGAYFILAFSFGGFGKKITVFTTAGKEGEILLFAHRGLPYYYPENSIEGLEGAKAHGFIAAELDIRRSANGTYLIFHDENCKRLLGLDAEIETLTIDTIKKYSLLASGHKTSAFVPTVDEVLSTEKNSMVFYFDMKYSSFKDADEIVALIKKYKCEKSVILTNWDFLFIFYVETKYPEIITGLEGLDAGKEWIYELMPKNLKPDFISGFYCQTNEAHINWLKKNDLMNSRIVYGVDHTNYDAALKYGFKNLIVDYDEVMRKDPRIINVLKK